MLNNPAGLLDNGLELLFFRHEDEVVHVESFHRDVGWNHHTLKPINLTEFKRLGIRGSGHATQLFVNAEVVLKRGGRHSLAFSLNIDVLFRLNGLMQALRQTSTGHSAARVLIDQNDLTILHNVFDVSMKQVVRAQRCSNVMQQT